MGYEILLAFSCILIYNQNTRCRYEKATDIQNIEEVVSQNTCGMTLFSPYGKYFLEGVRKCCIREKWKEEM